MDQDAEVKGNFMCIREHESPSPFVGVIRSRLLDRAVTQHSFSSTLIRTGGIKVSHGVIYYGSFLGSVHGTAGGVYTAKERAGNTSTVKQTYFSWLGVRLD